MEEQATIVSVQEDGNIKNMDNKFLIFAAAMYTCNHLIHVNIKILHLHLRTAKGRPIVREINSLLFSLLVITQSVQRRVILSMVIIWLRNTLD